MDTGWKAVNTPQSCASHTGHRVLSLILYKKEWAADGLKQKLTEWEWQYAGFVFGPYAYLDINR